MKQLGECIPEYDVFIANMGKKIMDFRLKRQFTRKNLAEKADISEKYLYEIEMGKKGCSCYILYRLARSLNISMDYLAEYHVTGYENLEDVWENLHGYQREMMVAIMQTIFDSFQKIW